MGSESEKRIEGSLIHKSWFQAALVAGFIALASLCYFWNLLQVPFHPDESTQIFMSSDVDLWLEDPLSLAWQSQTPPDARAEYRLLDAPFARTWIGLFRVFSATPKLPADWDWSATWTQNIQAGAYPSDAQLLVSRTASAIFFPFDLVFLFLIGRKLHGNLLGWLMIVIFCLNAVVLLHSRRAMSEGPLLFFTILTLWSFLQNPRYLFLSAIPAALAFNSKYSALPVFAIGLFALVCQNWEPLGLRKRLIFQIPIYFLIFVGITLFLNPFLWQDPFQALAAAVIARNTLLARQIHDLGTISQNWISTSPGKRLGSLIANLYLTPPSFHDVGNYIQKTQPSETRYLAVIFQNLYRGMIWGTLTLIMATLGYIFGWRKAVKADATHRAYYLILLIGSVLQFIFLMWAFSIPFQRYVLPLIPFSTVWIAIAIHELVDLLKNHQAAA
jgi:4-amino-4-deoxy-L-arabinose transferase-like glycosyltransferase